MALVYIKLLRFDVAMINVDKALKIDPNLITAILRKGKIYNGLKEYHKAIDVFENILKKDPTN